MVHIHREIILNLSEDIVLSVLTFLRLHTQRCTLCYLISRFQRFLTIKIESCFYLFGKQDCAGGWTVPEACKRPRYFRLTTVSQNGKIFPGSPIPPGSPPCPSTVESLQA